MDVISLKTDMKISKVLIGLCLSAAIAGFSAGAERLVILHTNDTHSQIEPDAAGRGGILQRKAIIDSVRGAEKNVLLIDAGDMVQGSLYFKFFRGDVEYPLFNMMDYDVRILGNHEFDNGLEELAKHYKDVKATRLSANYDFSGTSLEGLFDPYVIKEIDGKKIGIMGLNVNPESLISRQNYEGLKFKDIIKTANETAAFLKKKKKCDLVIAVTHIGYVKESDKTTDVELARASKDIDIIIGGHSHTLLNPDNPESMPSLVENSAGKPVLIAQTGKYGKVVGRIEIDLDHLKKGDGKDYKYSLIPVTDRFPAEQLDSQMVEFIEPYRLKVDSVNHRVIARALAPMDGDARLGGYPNWISDFALDFGIEVADSLKAAGIPMPEVDMGFMNVGGIRQSMPEGDVTEGEILSTFPFANRMTLISVTGKDIWDALQVSLRKGGEGISRGVRVLFDGDNIADVIINGKRIEPEKEYVVSTIDYAAEGNDDMPSWANGRVLWQDDEEMVGRVLRYIYNHSDMGLPIYPDNAPRFLPVYKKDSASE